ncbi:hypothetical protein [Rheinheimera sp.]|uniref:hypothetical protein n=1 Tax=Rheinheimera sp. TaxID=1869214 RepID=UPI002735F889|nr:hypothetical protein [Rheinheimera sp.]MDP2713553.1 hypothetical protein [Rheinheimera sp.]
MNKLILLTQFLAIFALIALVGILYLKLTKSKFTARKIYIFTMFGAVIGATAAEICFTFLDENFSFSNNIQSYLVGSFIVIVTLGASFYTFRWKVE